MVLGRFSALLIVTCMLCAAFVTLSLGARAEQGATDGYGYYWTDSDEPSPTVTFDWVDISAIGTDAGVSGDDEAFGPFPLGFSFRFYGTDYTEFYVSTNGLITFGGPDPSYAYRPIPDAATPNGFLAPYWANLCVNYSGFNSGKVYYTTQGADPMQQTVIEFYEVSAPGLNSITFEAVICQTGEVWFNYLFLGPWTGSFAVVGIEDPAGGRGVEYSYMESSLHDSLAVMFSLAEVSIGPGGSVEGHVGTDVSHTVHLWNHQAFGDDFEVSVATTSGWTVTVLDDAMNPLPDADTDGVYELGPITASGYETLQVLVSIPSSPVLRSENVTVTAVSVGSAVADDVLVTVDVLEVQFVPPYSEYGADTGGDALYEYLAVEMPVDVAFEGEYLVYGDLYQNASSSFVAMSYAFVTLPIGPGTVMLEFGGPAIRASGLDGPYMASVSVWDLVGRQLDNDLVYTDTYACTDFSLADAEFVPPLYGYPVDANSNGLYDSYDISVPLQVNAPGDYTVDLHFSDPLGTEISSGSQATYFGTGLQTVMFSVFGFFINDVDMNGTYAVHADLLDSFGNPLDSMDQYTETLCYDEFEGYSYLTYPVSDVGIDTDSDELFDYLQVSVTANSSVGGDFILTGSLYDGSWTPLAEAQVYVSGLGAGSSTTLPLEFSSEGLFASGYDGPYWAAYVLRDISWNVVDRFDFQTSYHAHDEFDHTGAVFEGPHSAVPVEGGTGWGYAGLLVTADLAVYSEAEYVVRMWVYDTDWDFVCFQDAAAYLAAGSQQVELFVPGWKLATAASSGAYVLSFELYDGYGTYLDYDVSYTDPYDPTEFDPTLPMIVSGWTFAAPEVDGSAGTDEWADAVSIDLSAADSENSVAGTLLVMHDWDNVYLCFDMTGDTTPDASDYVSMTFDTGEQGALTDGEDDMFEMDCGYYLDGPRHSVYDSSISGWAVDCWPFNPMLADHEGLAGAYGFGASGLSASDHRMYEFAIPLALLNASLDDVLGFVTAGAEGYGVYDGSTGAWSEWPTRWVDPSQVQFYGSLALPAFAMTTIASLDGTMGEGGWYVSDVEVSLAADPAEWLDRMMYSTDGGATWTEYSAPFTLSEDGVYDIEFYSVDIGGIEESPTSLTVRIDATAPTSTSDPTGTEGLEGWYVSPVVVEMSGSDPAGGSGVSEIMYRVDGGDWDAVNGVSVTVALEGSHTLEYYAVDVAGNSEDANNVTVKVDTVAPITTASVDGSVVNLTAADASSGLWITLYRIDGGTWTAYTTPFEVVGAGNHTVEFLSSDVAGNNETVQTLTVENEAGGAVDVLGLPWYYWIAIAAVLFALIFLMAVRKLYSMRRAAKESSDRAAVKDMGTAVAQFMDDTTSEPSREEPPLPEDDLDRLAEELDRK